MTDATNLPAMRGTSGGASPLATIPPAPRLPAFSPELAAAVDCAIRPTETIEGVEGREHVVPRVWPPLTRDVLDEAREAVTAYNAVLAVGATPQHLTAWLLAVNVVVANPRPPGELAAFAAALLEVQDEIPVAALNLTTRLEGTRRWRHFPSGGEVLSLLEPLRDEWTRTRAALHDVLARGREDAVA